MGAVLFALLIFLGIALSFIGGIIGVVDAFRVSTLWGLLALLVPFALLVFCIKFWNQRKWARNSLIMTLVGLGSSLLSIPFLGGFLAQRAAEVESDLEGFVIEEPPSAAEDSEADPDAAVEGAESEEGAELFQEAILPGLPTAAEIARAELLPSTNPDERLREIERERTDPYAYVPVPPAVRPTPPAPSNGGGGGNGNGGNGGGQTAGGGTNGQPTSPAPGSGNGAGAGVTPPTAPLPELPEPAVVASQVEVSGVASVDGATYAIVKAPGEPTSRYVRVGDRLSNGAVLVKRIENRPGTTPVVILEERGEEIALPVGANVGNPEEPMASLPINATTDVAALPNLR